MSKDPDVRGSLKGRLDAVGSDPVIPVSTLRRGKRRRLYALLATALGGLLSMGLVVLAIEVTRPPQPSSNRSIVSSPEGSSDPKEDKDEDPAVIDGPSEEDAPPPVTISFPDQSIELPAWSYCYGNTCVSGAPLRKPPDIGSPDEVRVDFPLPDWKFTAFFTPADQECGRSQQVPLEPTADGGSLLRPAGYAGTYDVTLFGDGDGSLSVTFRWTTPSDGPLPEPEARAAIIGGGSANPESYGVELDISNLAETPEEASAKITVSAEDGDSVSFDAERARGRCRPEGSIYFDGPDDKGREAAELGDGPFEYAVELTLDGQRYVANAAWPRDEIRGNEPSVLLDFRPELPGLTSSKP